MQLNGTEFYDCRGCRLPIQIYWNSSFWVLLNCSTVPFDFLVPVLFMANRLATHWQINAALSPAWQPASARGTHGDWGREREQLPMGKIITSDKLIICILFVARCAATDVLYSISSTSHTRILQRGEGFCARFFFIAVVEICDRSHIARSTDLRQSVNHIWRSRDST